MKLPSLKDVSIAQKKIIIREDFNVPMQDGGISSDARILAALPTLRYAIEHGAKTLILSHLGRPVEGQFDPAYSLQPVAKRLSTLLGQDIPLLPSWLDGFELAPGQVALAENVRFLPGEATNNLDLAQRMANCCDVFVMDAFAVAHRANASTEGIARFANAACAGFLLAQEVAALSKVIENPSRPVVAIIGGSKVSTKLKVLLKLLLKVDTLILGGGIMNTLLAAQGHAVGSSLYEADFYTQCHRLLAEAASHQVYIPFPVDVVTAPSLQHPELTKIKNLSEIDDEDMILDIGPQTQMLYAQALIKAKTILWNGPLGVFEMDAFSHGTHALAKAVASTSAYSVVGGGDTLAALEKFGMAEKMSYLSTGGGAFIEFLEGKTLPGLAVLEERFAH